MTLDVNRNSFKSSLAITTTLRFCLDLKKLREKAQGKENREENGTKQKVNKNKNYV